MARQRQHTPAPAETEATPASKTGDRTPALGSAGFSYSDHVSCFDALRMQQIRQGLAELPDACQQGHAPNPKRARVH